MFSSLKARVHTSKKNHKNKENSGKSNLSNLIKATIVADFGRFYLARFEHEDAQQTLIECVSKSKKNDVAVGDLVDLFKINDTQARIEKIYPRKNLVFRSDINKTKAFAANIDCIFWVVSSQPLIDLDLLNCALITAEILNIPIHIIHQKIDLDTQNICWQLLRPYELMQYPITGLSTQNTAGITEFFMKIYENHANKLKDDTLKDVAKTTDLISEFIPKWLFLGQSGVGKSSLMNQLMPDLQLKTNALSQLKNNKQSGKHTTTHTKLYRYQHAQLTHLMIDFVDSPGFQQFGLQHVSQTQLMHAFKDFRPYLGSCKFNNCQHINEPNCAIIQAVKKEMIDIKRYQHYLRLLEGIKQGEQKRYT